MYAPSIYRRLQTYKWCKANGLFTKLFRKFHNATIQDKIDAGSLSSLKHIVDLRRAEAACSLVVSVPKGMKSTEVWKAFQAFGNVDKIVESDSYWHQKSKSQQVIVQFTSEKELKSAIKHSRKLKSVISIYQRPFARIHSRNDSQHGLPAKEEVVVVPGQKCFAKDNEGFLLELKKTNNIDEQMLMCFKHQRITDWASRLRFCVCLQLEKILEESGASCVALPFGSTINGFGQHSSDLDLTLQFPVESSANRLHIRQINRILRSSLFGANKIIPIPLAKVPIIKIKHDVADFECDVSLSNRSGYEMSGLLHIFSCHDWRVRPLQFAVKNWASYRQLMPGNQPGFRFSSFTWTMLVFFYLMNVSPSILPSVRALTGVEGTLGREELIEIENATLKRSIKHDNTPHFSCNQNKDSLANLLRGFFLFYSNVNWEFRGISLQRGQLIRKQRGQPFSFHVENPLEPHLNVARNVKGKEVKLLRRELSRAQTILKTSNNLLDLWFDDGKMFSARQPRNLVLPKESNKLLYNEIA